MKQLSFLSSERVVALILPPKARFDLTGSSVAKRKSFFLSFERTNDTGLTIQAQFCLPVVDVDEVLNLILIHNSNYFLFQFRSYTVRLSNGAAT